MAVITTLSFAGRTEEALGHYQDALGAELVFLMRFRDSPDASHHRKDIEELVFHATFRIEGTEFMASDVGYFDEDATRWICLSTAPALCGSSSAFLRRARRRRQGDYAACRVGIHVLVRYRGGPFWRVLEIQRRYQMRVALV